MKEEKCIHIALTGILQEANRIMTYFLEHPVCLSVCLTLVCLSVCRSCLSVCLAVCLPALGVCLWADSQWRVNRPSHSGGLARLAGVFRPVSPEGRHTGSFDVNGARDRWCLGTGRTVFHILILLSSRNFTVSFIDSRHGKLW